NITMENIVAEAIFLNMFYDSKNVVRPTTANPPIFRNFFFKNITCSQANSAIVALGSEDSFIKNLSFENIDMRAENGISLYNVEEAVFHDLRVKATFRPLMTLNNLRHARFDTTLPPAARSLIMIEGSQSEDIHFSKEYRTTTIRTGARAPRAALIREQ
ncbi:MAG: hypothetical protein WA082_00280, partial [Candidatus Moraniibacteriota bacterium]